MADSDSGEDKSREKFSPQRGERMDVYTPLFKLRHYIHSVGDFKLFREVTVTQFLTAILAALFTWLLMRLIVPAPYNLAFPALALIMVPRWVSIAEDSGRSPLKESAAWLKFYSGPRYYKGAMPLKRRSLDERWLENMIVSEEEEVTGHRQKPVRIVAGGVRRTLGLFWDRMRGRG